MSSKNNVQTQIWLWAEERYIIVRLRQPEHIFYILKNLIFLEQPELEYFLCTEQDSNCRTIKKQSQK